MKLEIAAATLALTIATPLSTQAAESKPQNVVFMLVDDMSFFSTSIYGGKTITPSPKSATTEIHTPNIDRVARQGVMCTHAYAHALSEATRIALMTGMNNGRNYLVTKALHESQITFGDVFQHAGYATGMYGKWKQSRGTKDVPAEKYISTFGWDDYACFDVFTELQRYINPVVVVNDEVESYRGRTDLDPETGRRWYGPDLYNRKALDFIEKNKDNPFFLYYPLVLIHAEHRPTPDTQPTTEFDTMPEGDRNYNNINYLPDMIEYADKMIGRVVDKIEELGLRDNTLIVIMGDNGSVGATFEMVDGKVHVGGKGQINYAGEQVPLIFSQPGTVVASEDGEPVVYEDVVDLTDLYPTIIESCGIEIPNPEQIDGISMWDQLRGKSSKPHRDVIYKWYNANFTQNDKEFITRYAHTAKYKYYAPDETGKYYPEGRFFDLEADPTEFGGVQGPMISKFKKYWHSGMELEKLTAEQQEVMAKLKAVTEANAYTPVSSIEIKKAPKKGRVGEMIALGHQVLPSNATRNGVIWESSDKTVATVNKFGEVTPLKAGKVTISLYSWDDAWPIANGPKTGGYLRTGMNDKITLEIAE